MTSDTLETPNLSEYCLDFGVIIRQHWTVNGQKKGTLSQHVAKQKCRVPLADEQRVPWPKLSSLPWRVSLRRHPPDIQPVCFFVTLSSRPLQLLHLCKQGLSALL